LDFNQFRQLPKAVISLLNKNCRILAGEIVTFRICEADKTEKFLIKLKDSYLIESALLSSDDARLTACISTQVGCAVSCVFCASGMAGFKRNLTKEEIISQFLLMRHHAQKSDKDITNVVFMGIGEPLLNFENLISAIDLLTSPYAANIGSRRITVSTSGIIPGIKKLADYKKQINLSVSLHSAFDDKRNTLVPVNKKYNIKALMDAVKDYISKTRRHVTFEYVLISGLNDSSEDADALSGILKGISCKVNLIPYNRIEGADFKTSASRDVKKFADRLLKNKINAVRRRRKGFDINSGCGQLKAVWK